MSLTVDPRVGFAMLYLLPVLGLHMPLLLRSILANAVRLVRLLLILVIVFSCDIFDTRYSFLVLWILPLILVLDCRVVPFACAGVFICHYFCGRYPWMSSDLCDCFVFDVRSVFVVLLSHLQM